MAAFIAKRASFLAADDLTHVVRLAQPKLPGKKCVKLGRTKCTKLVTQVLAPSLKEEILTDLGNGKFSILIDESTDIGALPMLCLVIRYLSKSKRKIITTFYRLIHLSGRDSETITACVLGALKEDKLNINNLVGIGCDGASVLTGRHSGVFARLKEHKKDLLMVRCICHSLHLAVSQSIDELPSNLPVLVRQTYDWFSRSSARKEAYSELYKKMNDGAMPKKIVRMVETRWLSLYSCVNVILQQWDALLSYFDVAEQDERGESRYIARSLSAMYNDLSNKVYLVFCRTLLQDFTRVNQLFQSENADCLKLLKDLRLFYERLLRKFVVGDRIDQHPYSDIENFDFEKYVCAVNAIHFGIDFDRAIEQIHDLHAQQMIRDRCKRCLLESARQVRARLPDTLNSLCLLESLSQDVILKKKASNIGALLMQFPSLAPDPSATEEEFRALTFCNENPGRHIDSVQFWLAVKDSKDAAGDCRFENVANFALALFCLPFSNASVERVFSIMNIVKNKLRNRLLCNTVEAILMVRYGLDFLDVPFSKFSPTKKMLLRFTDAIYESKDVDNECDRDSDLIDALDILHDA